MKEGGEERLIRCLPHDLAVEILSWLPITSVIKFRLACRSWNLLFRDLHFAKMHMSHSLISKRTCLIFHSKNQLRFVEFSDLGDNEIVRKFDIPFANSMPQFCVIGSFNGLLCLFGSNYFTQSIFVFNPFTRDYRHTKLPRPIGFNCQRAQFGFGFHPVTKEYKVIIIAYECNCTTQMQSFRPDFLIYNVGKNEWRSIGKPPYNIKRGSSWGVLVGGKLHWLCLSDDHFNYLISSFDLVNDSFEVLKLDTITLPTRQGHYFYVDLVALGDRLSVTVLHPRGSIRLIDVWVMKQYGKQESWIKMYTLSPDFVIPRDEFCRVIGLLKNGEILIQCGTHSENFFSYNNEDARCKRVWFREMPKQFRTILHVANLEWIMLKEQPI